MARSGWPWWARYHHVGERVAANACHADMHPAYHRASTVHTVHCPTYPSVSHHGGKHACAWDHPSLGVNCNVWSAPEGRDRYRLRRYVHTYGVTYIHGTNDKEGCYLLSTYLLTYLHTYIHTPSHHCTMPTFPFPLLPPRLASAHTQHTRSSTRPQIRPCSLPRVRNQSSCVVNGSAPHEETNLSRGKTESLRGRLLGAVRREVMGWEQDVSQSVVRER